MSPQSELSGKHILVTGASSGIGRQCAIAAAQKGAVLTLLGRNEKRLEETLKVLSRQEDQNHRIFTLDLTGFGEIKPLVQKALELNGPVSGFVHSAGVELTLPLKVMSPDHFNKLFSINVTAGFEIARLLSNKKNISRDGVSFVFISSVMGSLGRPGKVGYCSSKGALIAGAKAMALELAAKGIRVNCVSPGVVETAMTREMFAGLPEASREAIKKEHPLGLGQPEDVASAVIFLLSPGARWITGTDLVVDGGYSAL